MRSVVVCMLLGAGCSLSIDFGGTRYRCDEGICPAGQVCGADGFCGPPSDATGGLPDADVDPPDADPGTADGPTFLDPPWWDYDWLYRRRITVTNLAVETLPNDFQVGFPIDIESLIGPSASFAQIRVMHWNSTSTLWAQMTRVIDQASVGTDEHLWIPLWEPLDQDESVDHYWLYYGNDAVTSGQLSDPNDLFEFYAPFTATDSRLEFNGTATVSGGNLLLEANSNLRTLAPYRWGAGYALDFQMDVQQWDARFWGGFQRVDDYIDDQPWIIWISRGPGVDIAPEFLADDSGSTVTQVGTAVPLPPGRRTYGIERFPTKTVYYHEYTEIDRFTHGTFTTDLQVRLANESIYQLVFDMIRIRLAADPHPQVTLGPEEDQP